MTSVVLPFRDGGQEPIDCELAAEFSSDDEFLLEGLFNACTHDALAVDNEIRLPAHEFGREAPKSLLACLPEGDLERGAGCAWSRRRRGRSADRGTADRTELRPGEGGRLLASVLALSAGYFFGCLTRRR